MDDNLKELLAQKKAHLKEKQKGAEIQQYKDHFRKISSSFLRNTDMQMKWKHAKLKPFSQSSILCGRDSCQSKKFAHIPMEMSTCAF